MNYYLCPIAPVTIGASTVMAPKYFDSDLKGLTIATIPFGREGIALVSLASPNAALAAEADVYAFPADLTTPLTLADAAALGSYLANFNVPTTWLAAGLTFGAVLRQLAQIFLVAQFISGQTGKALFAGTGKTISSTVGVTALPVTPGVFDLTGVKPTATLGDILVAPDLFKTPSRTVRAAGASVGLSHEWSTVRGQWRTALDSL